MFEVREMGLFANLAAVSLCYVFRVHRHIDSGGDQLAFFLTKTSWQLFSPGVPGAFLTFGGISGALTFRRYTEF